MPESRPEPKTLFLRDVLNTPGALANTLAALADPAERLAGTLLAGGARRIVALGNGSSLYAAAASVYLHGALAAPTGALVWAAPTGDYALYPSPLGPDDALVGVSASGEIVDLLDLFESLRGRHQLVGITNAAGSTLTRLVDHSLVMQAGPSLVPTTTKTFTTSIAALHLLWLGLLRAQGIGSADELRRELLALPRAVEASLDEARAQVGALAEPLANCSRLFVFGAGPAWPLAQEAALVFKEIAGLPAEGMQTREMAQGTTSVVDPSVGVVAVNPPGRGQKGAREVLAQCAALGAPTLEVGEAGLKVTPAVHELLAPIVYGGPLFLLAAEVAARRGVDTDHPAWEAGYLRLARRQGG